MNIAALRETSIHEKRVAITPELVKKYLDLGLVVYIQKETGQKAGFSNDSYLKAGAKVIESKDEILSNANILVTVSSLISQKDLEHVKENIIIIGLLDPFKNNNLLKNLATMKINCISLELVPRISRAQSIDALSSQSNLAGYKSIIDAASVLKKAIPMMMTAAGTIVPAKILILGAGVAGLQAIATAKRLGAIVTAFDVRPEVEEQVKSLGAKFVSVDIKSESKTTLDDGYAKEMDKDYKHRQVKKIEEEAIVSDIVITTALIPGKKSPILIPTSTLKKMKAGSVIIDLSGISGGNCEKSEYGKTVIYNDITISSPTNLSSDISRDSSILYSKNIFNFTKLLFTENNTVNVNMEDEIIAKATIIRNGKIINKLLE